MIPAPLATKEKKIGPPFFDVGCHQLYQVVTKGRILSDGGSAGPQVDVLVLSSAYPKALIDKKLYLAGGVLAAFECKVTLKAAHIRDLVEHAVSISRLTSRRMGSPFRELNSPIVYGLLAHAHVWDAPPPLHQRMSRVHS